jgi:L-cysteine:1D-myo-inositol 2-amino-2-deoxy-alpha-D-glucopyranoside ligase
MWTDELLVAAENEMSALRSALMQTQVAPTNELIQSIVGLLADDLNTSQLIDSINLWVASTQSGGAGGNAQDLTNALDALLGINI